MVVSRVILQQSLNECVDLLLHAAETMIQQQISTAGSHGGDEVAALLEHLKDIGIEDR